MVVKTIVGFLLSFVFIKCETKTESSATSSLKFHPLQTKPNSIIGNWEDSGFLYTHELRVNENGSFTDKYISDVGTAYSEGTWTKHSDYFILTSLVKSKELGFSETYLDTIRLKFNGDSLYQWNKSGKNIDFKFTRVW